MSWSEHTGFTSRGVDNTWISVAGTLEKFRATEKPIEGSNHSIQNIFEKAGAEGLDAADKAYEITGTGEGTSERIIPLQSPPVAAFAPTEATKKTPPPPVRRTGHARSEGLVSMNWPVAPSSAAPNPTHNYELDDVEWIMEPIVPSLESPPPPLASTQSEQAGLNSRDANEKWTALLEALEIPNIPEKEVLRDE